MDDLTSAFANSSCISQEAIDLVVLQAKLSQTLLPIYGDVSRERRYRCTTPTRTSHWASSPAANSFASTSQKTLDAEDMDMDGVDEPESVWHAQDQQHPHSSPFPHDLNHDTRCYDSLSYAAETSSFETTDPFYLQLQASQQQQQKEHGSRPYFAKSVWPGAQHASSSPFMLQQDKAISSALPTHVHPSQDGVPHSSSSTSAYHHPASFMTPAAAMCG